MPNSFKHENIAQLAMCPEMVQDLPVWKMQIASGVASPPSITAAMGVAIANHHNGNVDTTENNDDHYNNLYAYCKTGSNAGEIRKISNYACPVGVAPQNAVFTLAAAAPGETTDLPNAVGAGETWYLFAPLPAMNVSPTADIEKLQREYETLTFDPAPFIAGLLSGGISFDMEIPGLEQVRDQATGATLTDPDRFGHLLQGLGQRVVGAGSQVKAAPPSTVTRIYVNSNSGFTASRIPETGKSNMVQVQDTGAVVRGSNVDEVRRITAIGTAGADDYIEVSPQLSSIPVPGKECYACETIIPAELNHSSVTFLHLKDDQIFEVIGCLISASGSWNYGQLIQLSIDSQGSTWNFHDSDGWDGVQSQQPPIPVLEGSAFFNESLGATPALAALPMTEFGFDYSVERTIQKVTTGQTMKVSGRTPTANIKFADVDANMKQSTSTFSELQGSRGYLLAQGGVSAGNTVALLMYGQIESMGRVGQDAIMYWDAALKHSDGDMQSSPYKMLLCRF